jgi:hypothetical protein
VAHKVVGLGDYDNLIQRLREEEGFPIFEELKAKEGELKITVTSLRDSIKRILDRLEKNERKE